MGNILRKIVQDKKQKERKAYKDKLFMENCLLPDYMQSQEYKEMQFKREKEGLLNISNFLKDLLNQQDNG
jgi:hypothetical protein